MIQSERSFLLGMTDFRSHINQLLISNIQWKEKNKEIFDMRGVQQQPCKVVHVFTNTSLKL